MTRDLHDFNISAYEVRASERYIVLHAEWPESGGRRVQAIFDGVVGHRFEHSLEGNIVNSVEAIKDVEKFFARNDRELRRYTQYGFSVDTLDGKSFSADLLRRDLVLYKIFSSYGLSGWVCCRQFGVIDVHPSRV